MPDKGTAKDEKSRGVFHVAAILLFLAFFIFLCQLVNFGSFHADAHGPGSLPVSIRASSQADYSRDPNAPSIPPISENILRQIITDVPATGSPQDRLATLQVLLTQSVPSTTPYSTSPTAGLPPGGTPVPTHTGQPTVQPSKVTPVPTHTGQPTIQPTIVTPVQSPAPKPTKAPKATKPPKPPKPPKPSKPGKKSAAGDKVGSPTEEGTIISRHLPRFACNLLKEMGYSQVAPGIPLCQPEK